MESNNLKLLKCIQVISCLVTKYICCNFLSKEIGYSSKVLIKAYILEIVKLIQEDNFSFPIQIGIYQLSTKEQMHKYINNYLEKFLLIFYTHNKEFQNHENTTTEVSKRTFFQLLDRA